MRFLYKFTLLLSILIFISSTIQFFAADRFFRSTTNSLFLTINEKAANNLREAISSYFKNITHLVEKIAADPTLRANQEALNKTNELFPEVNALFVLDPKGKVLLASGADVNSAANINLLQRDYFQHAIQGETYVSDVFTSGSNRQVVAIATPIIENNQISGILVASVDCMKIICHPCLVINPLVVADSFKLVMGRESLFITQIQASLA